MQDCVAFQGIHGAYSEQALRHYSADVTSYPCPTLTDLFDTLASRKVNTPSCRSRTRSREPSTRHTSC
ncbi:MAG: prephenate dehydratase domain-containing protein [Anaerolineae bacterium]